MKKYINLSIIVILLILIVSCSASKNDDSDTNNENLDEQSYLNVGESYDVVGRLISEGAGSIEVEVDDVIRSFNTTDDLSNYYLGEYIRVKSDGDTFKVYPYNEFNFNKRYTSNKELIYRISGRVENVNEKEIEVRLEDGSISFQNPGNFDLHIGTNVIIDYISTNDGNKLVNYYDTANVMSLVVKEIKKDYDGKMIIKAANGLDTEYIIPVNSDVLLNFVHSSLAVGDNIEVYFDYADDNDPPQISSTMILKEESKHWQIMAKNI